MLQAFPSCSCKSAYGYDQLQFAKGRQSISCRGLNKNKKSWLTLARKKAQQLLILMYPTKLVSPGRMRIAALLGVSCLGAND